MTTATLDCAPRASSNLPAPASSNKGPSHVSRRLLIVPFPDESGRAFIFNPLSGALDVATAGETDALRAAQGKSDSRYLTKSMRRRLLRSHAIFETPAAEELYLERSVEAAWESMNRSYPNFYVICPTLACNLGCAYCFEGDSLLDKQQGVMTTAQVEKAFEAIGALGRKSISDDGEEAEPRAKFLQLFGGEPFLPSTRKVVREILDRAAAGGFLVNATSNGVNLTRFSEILRDFRDIFTTVQVTLDGSRAIHNARRMRLGGQGTFDEIVDGIELLCSLDIDVDLRVNLDAQNVDTLPEFAEFICERGWDQREDIQILLSPVFVHTAMTGCSGKYEHAMNELAITRRIMDLSDKHPEIPRLFTFGFLRHLEHLTSLLEPNRLGKPRRHTSGLTGPRYWYCEQGTGKQWLFTPDGYLYTCSEAVGKPKHAVGRFDPELEIWRNESTQWLGRTILSHDQCRQCSISTLCGGGCHLAAREQPGKSGGAELIQIALPGRQSQAGSGSVMSSGKSGRDPDPYCAMAQEIVVDYLKRAARALPLEPTQA